MTQDVNLQWATCVAPVGLAPNFMALTEQQPLLALDVGEVTDDATHYRFTVWYPADVWPEVEAFGVAQGVVWQPGGDVPSDVDYVALTRANFPPLAVARWWIARNGEPAPEGLLGLQVAPNQAFGSGEHATTSGCLLAIDWLAEQSVRFDRVLDFGAGSGILALAVAKDGARLGVRAPIVAVDNDAPSVAICAENAALNGVAEQVVSLLGEVPPKGPFEVVLANILLQPLCELALQLVAAVVPGGMLVMSGFLEHQAETLAGVYQALGMTRIWRHQEKEWMAEVWQRCEESLRAS